MKIVTAIAAGLCCVSATGDVPYAGMPPERLQGEAAGFVVFADDIGRFCGESPDGLITLACTKTHRELGKVVILPNPCAYGEEVFARLACHEKAHAAFGWTGAHEE